MNTINVGIDLSLNSTGLYFNYKINNIEVNDYYILTNNRTKKSLSVLESGIPYMLDNTNGCITQLTIIDLEYNNYNIYPETENKKTGRVECIAKTIYNIIEKINKSFNDDTKIIVGIEGLAFGTSSTNALCELSALNFLTRLNLVNNLNNVIIDIIPPSENKKFASGIGNASKDEMMFCWSKTESGNLLYNNNILKEIKIKLDDISDAYFLALCAKEKQQDL